MLTIRLKRMGAKKVPFYRVVVQDSRRAPSSRPIEEVGTYDPLQKPALVKLDRTRIDSWIAKGAKASETLRSLLKKTPAQV